MCFFFYLYFPEEVKERFKTEFFDKVIQKLETCPETFIPAVEAMLRQCRNIHTDSHLVTSIFTFAKYSGAAPALIRRGASAKRLAVKRLNLAGTRQIGVQPTATARRRPHMGRGGRQIGSGRPPRTMRREHAYARHTATSALLPTPRHKKAPHSLGHCVTMNMSLGRTHSAK